MSVMKKIKYGVTGFTLGAVFFGGIAFGATTQIEVSLDPIKFVVNNVDKTPLNGKYNNNGTAVPASLSYNGTTYVPLKMVGEMVDKKVAWDGTTKSVLIGDVVGGQQNLNDLAPLNVTGEVKTGTNNMVPGKSREVFKTISAIVSAYSPKTQSQSYNIKGQYKQLNFEYGSMTIIESGTGGAGGKISVYGDGKELWTGNAVQGVILNQASVSISGVQELEIRFDCTDSHIYTKIGIANPVLIK